ncbi:MAG: hypothetical protein VX933_05155 [Bacteroidota bacterium]|nr:hypothetical protein [Bacteroidota bacterium]
MNEQYNSTLIQFPIQSNRCLILTLFVVAGHTRGGHCFSLIQFNLIINHYSVHFTSLQFNSLQFNSNQFNLIINHYHRCHSKHFGMTTMIMIDD